MALIDWYFLFALTTGVTFAVTFAIPIVRELQLLGVDNLITRRLWLTAFVTLVYTSLTAPIMIWALIVPRYHETVYNSMHKAFLLQDN